MSATAPAIKTSSTLSLAAQLREFRIIPPIEKSPAIVSFVQTIPGKIVLLALFGPGLRIFRADLLNDAEILIPLTVITLIPELRRVVLALTPILLLVVHTVYCDGGT